MIIMHTANRAEYEDEIKTGHYGKKSLDRCGFVHCSDFDTYYLVAPNFKDDFTEKVILVIDTEKLDCQVKWEDGGSHDYPHINIARRFSFYGSVKPFLPCQEKGRNGFTLRSPVKGAIKEKIYGT